MAIKTTSFDPSGYLKSSKAQAELLADAFETGNAKYITNALGTIARARGIAQVARNVGVTREALYKALSDDGAGDLAIIDKSPGTAAATTCAHSTDDSSNDLPWRV